MPYGSAGADANPVLNSMFRVEIDNIQLNAFAEAEVTGGDLNKIEDRTGIDTRDIRESSGLRNPWTITLVLKERDGGHDDVLALIEMADAGSKDRRGMSIITLDMDGVEIGRESFQLAWVVKHEKAGHKAEDKDVAITHTFELSAIGRTVE